MYLPGCGQCSYLAPVLVTPRFLLAVYETVLVPFPPALGEGSQCGPYSGLRSGVGTPGSCWRFCILVPSTRCFLLVRLLLVALSFSVLRLAYFWSDEAAAGDPGRLGLRSDEASEGWGSEELPRLQDGRGRNRSLDDRRREEGGSWQRNERLERWSGGRRILGLLGSGGR